MAKATGANMETVRRRNRAAILRHINDRGPSSRKDLAEVLGLTPAAVTQICTDLMEEGILIETGIDVRTGGAGRRKVLLDLNYASAHILVMNIDPKQTTIAITDLRGNCTDVKSIVTDTTKKPQEFLEKLCTIARELISAECSAEDAPMKADVSASDILIAADASGEGVPIAAVGIGITGLVDKDTGKSIHAYGIWEEEVDIAGCVGAAFEVPIYVENNVNAYAMAEILYGCGREYENLMLIKWGPGVGCAIMIDRQIYEGRHAKAAELGHFIVEKNGCKCLCGRRGCLETKVSYQALLEIAPFSEEEFGEVYEKAVESGTSAPFDAAIDLFARSIVNSATIVAPNRIVITGTLFADEAVRGALIRACASYDPTWNEERILYSSLSDQESYIGPAAVCTNALLFS